MRVWVVVAAWLGLAASAGCVQVLGADQRYGPAESGATGGASTTNGAGGQSSTASSGGFGGGDMLNCPSGKTACGTSCVDILNDPLHCGRCDHNCEGQPCEAALCKPVVLAMDQHGPASVAVDATSVYWTSLGDGAIRKVDLAGGAPVTLATAQNEPWGITLDGGFVYWANNGDSTAKGEVRKVPVAGGPPVTIVSGENSPDTVAVINNTVVWGDIGYDFDQGLVKKIDPAPGATPTTLSTLAHTWWTVARGASDVYGVSGEGLLQRFPLDGGMPVTLTQTAQGALKLAVGKDAVYYTSRDDGAIRKVLLGGGAPIVVCDDSPNGAMSSWGIAVDDAYVYWTEDTRGLVKRAKLSGDAAETIASGQANPLGIALDDSHVYWVNINGGTVVKLHK